MAETSTIILAGVVVAIILGAGAIGYSYMSLNSVLNELDDMKTKLDILISAVAPEGMDLLAAAMEEGTVTYYCNMLSDQCARVAEAFKAKYPFMEIQWEKSYTYAIYEKYQQELSAGQVRADILQMNDRTLFMELKQDNNLLYYNSSVYDHIPEEYQDQGYWSVIRLYDNVILYNTDYVSELTSWNDLLDPAYKGHIVWGDVRTVGDAYLLYYALRDEVPALGLTFWQNLSDQDLTFITSYAQSRDKVMSGEFWIGVGVGYYVPYAQERGAPVEGMYAEEGTPVSESVIGIPEQAPHPNAAKLLFNYLLSEECQSMLAREFNFRVLRANPPNMPAWGTYDVIVIHDWDRYLDQRETYRQEFAQIFGLG